MVEPVRPRIPAHIANWLIALIIALPLAWLLGDFSFRYHWNVGTYLPFSRRPLELLGLWLVCYWGVVAVRHLLKQHGANPP